MRDERVEMHIDTLIGAEDDNLIDEIRRCAGEYQGCRAVVEAIRSGWPGNLKG